MTAHDLLLHFSADPLLAIRSFEQAADAWMKPNGLWVSAGHGEDSWPDWCRGEGFALDRFAHATEVVLRPEARVLRITSVAEFDAFDERFGEQAAHVERTYRMGLRWAEVARRYQGVVIAPYLWERRLSETGLWYYSWDCASGCIWDAEAVAELRPVHGLDLRLDRGVAA